MRCGSVLAVLLLLPLSARADVPSPGHFRVPHDFVIEVEQDYPNHRFWLVMPRDVQALSLAPGRPFRIDGSRRGGLRYRALIIAAPPGFVEGMDERKVFAAVTADNPPAGVLRSQRIDFGGWAPFFDSRDRLVDHYRLELNSDEVRLVWLGQNEGSVWVKVAWAVAGLSASVALVLAGLFAVRRLWRAVR
jgi:hypothetical protein